MSKELTEWEQKNQDGSSDLVITLRNPDGEVRAELVILEGTRVIIGPSNEHFGDGSVGASVKVERL